MIVYVQLYISVLHTSSIADCKLVSEADDLLSVVRGGMRYPIPIQHCMDIISTLNYNKQLVSKYDKQIFFTINESVCSYSNSIIFQIHK